MISVKPSNTVVKVKMKPQNLQHDLVMPMHAANQKLTIMMPPRIAEIGAIDLLV